MPKYFRHAPCFYYHLNYTLYNSIGNLKLKYFIIQNNNIFRFLISRYLKDPCCIRDPWCEFVSERFENIDESLNTKPEKFYYFQTFLNIIKVGREGKTLDSEKYV